MVSAGAIAGGGFRVVRERPGAVMLWALIYQIPLVALALAMWPGEATRAALARGDADLAMGTSLGLGFWLAELFFLAAFVVLLTAAMRAALRPGEGGIGAIRLGMDELRMGGLALLQLVGFYVGLFVVGLVLAIPLGLLGGAVAGAGGLTFLIVGEGVVLTALAVWILVRLSLAYPLTLMRGRIVIGEAWRLSSGRFWTLFGGYLIIFLSLFAFTFAATALTSGTYLLEIARGGFTLAALQAATRAQLVRQLAGIDAMMVAGWALSALVGGISLGLYGGAMATAARSLSADAEGMARTFS